MFVRVVNWATVLCLALAAAFAGLLQWNEYAVSLYQPSAERELLRSLSLVPIAAFGFFALGAVAWIVSWRFSRSAAAAADRSDVGIAALFFGCYLTLVAGCLLTSPLARPGLAVAGGIWAFYVTIGGTIWLGYRWIGRWASGWKTYRWIMSTESWTYVWLVYGKLATTGLLSLGYLNFELRWQPWVALLACGAYLVTLRYVLLFVHGLLMWPILTEEEMAP